MATVRAYDDGETFWREVADPLRARAVLNNAFLGNAHRVRAGANDGVARIGVFDDGALVLGAIMIAPHRLCLGDLGSGERGVVALARQLAGAETALPGVFAATRLADTFMIAWRTISGRPVQINENEGRRQNLYQVVHVKPPAGVPGAMRAAQAAERDLLIEWEVGFATEAKIPSTERDPARLARTVDECLADGTLLVWDVDGAPTAMLRRRPIGTDGVRVSGVYTPPEKRARGYAAALTAAFSQGVLDEGLFCCLHADASNDHTNRLYRRIGYVNLATYEDFVFSAA